MKGLLDQMVGRTALVCGCLLAAASAPAEVIDRVLAVAAGEVIMLSDVEAARQFGFAVPSGSTDPTGDVLTTLIDRALILAEVERYAPPEPAAEEMEAELRALRARFGTDAAYAAALARTGRAETHLRETIRQNLRIRAYLDQRFTAATPAPRQTLIDEWVAGLRRRADIVDLYRPATRN